MMVLQNFLAALFRPGVERFHPPFVGLNVKRVVIAPLRLAGSKQVAGAALLKKTIALYEPSGFEGVSCFKSVRGVSQLLKRCRLRSPCNRHFAIWIQVSR